MKSISKAVKLGIVAAACVIVGLVLFVVGASIVNWDFRKLDATVYTAKRFEPEFDSDIKRVEISLSSFPIDIVSGSELSVDYYEASNANVTVKEDNGTLKITEYYVFNLAVGIFTGGRELHRFKLSVPQGFDIEVGGPNCEMTICGVNLSKLYIDVVNLDLTIEGVTVGGDFTAKATNSDLKIYSMTAANAEIVGANINADISYSDSGVTKIDGTNVDVVIDRSYLTWLTVEGTNINIDASWLTSLTCAVAGTNADISFERVKVDKLVVDAINLDAELEIIGNERDFTVETDGRGKLPADKVGETDKAISLSGVNCNVDLEFVISA